jgi:rhodanese-related sulfurtransferase
MPSKTINSSELSDQLSDGSQDYVLVDVRSLDEHLSETIKNAICIPHDTIERHTDKLPKDKEIILFCRSGNRSKKAKETLDKLGYTNIKDLAGGILSWNDSNLPVLKQRKSISIQRQVMIGAGSLISVGAILGNYVNYQFWLLPSFVGIGLLFAGLTGFCGMALILEKMPWNKIQ